MSTRSKSALVLLACLSVTLLQAEEPPFLYPQTAAFKQDLATARLKGLTLTDYHIHLRGGMTLEKAAQRQDQSGIRSAVLENFGREWPLSDNAKLKDFIDAQPPPLPNGQRLPVGIQVNDRDWFTQLDPALRQRLDFVLADTMIMGVTAEGKPRRLWLPDVTIADPEAWMLEYLAHNLRILDEPISILANPTYLPPCIAPLYDQLWTADRMRQVIAKAVANGVALEIQAGSDFPKPAFLKLAKQMGAKFSFGSNNFDDKTKDLARWFQAIALLDLTPADLWSPKPAFYPPADRLAPSPGDTTYYISPRTGDDSNAGTTSAKPWQSIAKVNALKLAPGDRVVIAPGGHQQSLKPTAVGTAQKPVTIEFLPGVHEFAVAAALRRPWFISNSCDAPQVPKPVAILVENSAHLRVQGGGVEGAAKTLILMGGRMIEVINHQAEDITYRNLVFDLKRPTVSEFRVMEVEPNGGIIQVAEGSTYQITDGRFAWTGDWGQGPLLRQLAEPATGRCWRGGADPFGAATATELGQGRVRLTYANGNGGLVKGRQHHFRLGTRDSVGIHNNRSKNIAFLDCDFYALTNMGIVSQFTENLTFRNVRAAPPAGTFRTCPAWADVLHFSGCKGEILVDSCIFSGSQDDPINVHGTYLRIIEKTAADQLHLRFMHPQTYGFAAFAPGDEIAVISHTNLRELPNNPRRKVTAIVPQPGDGSGKDWLLTLDAPVPAFNPNDVVDNLTWYPDFTARNCQINMDPTRGFLITTRGKVVIENNAFSRCTMAGILVAADANGWFESGQVREMVIRNNRFIACGIEINPETSSNNPAEPVHENIRIERNFFDGGGISAKSVRGLAITGNRSPGGSIPLHLQPSCSEVTQENNAAKAVK